MLSLLNWNQKESTAAELMNAENICIVFNIVNHESLVAASMLHDVLKRRGENAILLDIRDALVRSNTYVWVGCGDEFDLMKYYGTNISRKSLITMVKNSIFIDNTAEADSCSISEGMVVKAAELAELVIPDSGKIRIGNDSVTFRKWALTSMMYHNNGLDKTEYFTYSELLNRCYLRYHGMEYSDAPLESFSPGSIRDEAVEEAKHAITNKALTRKVHEVNHGGRGFARITSMGPDVYNLIRRLNMAKKNFIHVSESFLCGVIFSNAHVETMAFSDHFRMLLSTDRTAS